MRVRRFLTLGAGLVGVLGAQQTPVGAQETRLVGRLPTAERAHVDSLLHVARTAGLPTEPLVDRALEGAAKRATPERIVMATALLLTELQTAHRAFGDSATAGELTAGASALRAGATETDLRTLRERRGIHPLTVAASVLADLVAVGVPADTAIVAVLTLADRLPDAQYVAFQRNIERDIAQGASPSAALGVRLRSADLAAVELNSTSTPASDPTNPRTRRKRKP